jgi:Xaa-Pro aminopeptidase
MMVGDSVHDANLLYAVGMFVPDAFIYLRFDGKPHMVMSDLEVDRARQQARHCRVLALSQCRKLIQKAGGAKTDFPHIIRFLLRRRRVKKVLVPENFPLGLARELQKLKVRVRVKPGPFFAERALKHAEEVKKISAALTMGEVGLAEGIQALRNAKVGHNRRLLYHNLPLTSDKQRAIMDTANLQAGGLASHTIAAGGAQAADPHERGHGSLRANEPIILDVFPRSQKTGYFGDITRTVVKGRASEAVRKLFYTVQRAQEVALEHLRHHTTGREVHERVQAFFRQEGYTTAHGQRPLHGFFHGTGHGLGLEVHEPPRLSANSTDLVLAGHVVTVEPGLYYPGLGGVRLEDVAFITTNGPQNLTQFEKELEI